MKIKKNTQGFTLIELLVVIAIIGFLTTTAMVSFQESRARARDLKRITDIEGMIKAIEAYVTAEVIYPGKEGIDKDGVILRPGCDFDMKSKVIAKGYINNLYYDPLIANTPAGCSLEGAGIDDYFFYAWESDQDATGKDFCLSINKLETEWAKELLFEKYGTMNATGVGKQNIGDADFNYCFEAGSYWDGL